MASSHLKKQTGTTSRRFLSILVLVSLVLWGVSHSLVLRVVSHSTTTYTVCKDDFRQAEAKEMLILPEQEGYFAHLDETCAASRYQHPLSLTKEQQVLEFGFTLETIQSLDTSTFDPVLKDLIRDSQTGANLNHSVTKKCSKSLIPRKLHWSWSGSPLPEKYARNIYLFALQNPGWEIFLWSDHDSKFLASKLESIFAPYHFRNITELLQQGAFFNGDLILKETNLAGKSDYLRMEAVYLEGGIYQDTDANVRRPFDSVGNLFRWPFFAWSSSYKNLGSCVFGAEQHSSYLRFALELARENCLHYNRCGVLTGAGPDFVTAAATIYDSPEITIIKDDFLISRGTKHGITFHSMDATWLAAYNDKTDTAPKYEGVQCGKDGALVKSCKECGPEMGDCSGDCVWNYKENECELAIVFNHER